MKTRFLPLVVASLSSLLATADTNAPAPAAGIVATPEWIELQSGALIAGHPGLSSARARFNAANAEAAGIRRIADPTVRLGGAVFDERNMKSREEGNLVYGLDQKLPVMGKESAARKVAEAEAAAAATRVEGLFQQLRFDLARTVYEAALAEEAVRIGTEDLAWIEVAVDTAQTRYQSTQGSAVEVLRLQNERTRRTTQLESDRQRAAAARAWVNHALGREPLDPVPSFRLPDPAPALRSTAALQQRAELNGPTLRQLERERRAAQATVEATRRSARPDLAVGVEGREYAGDAGFRNGTVTLSLSLPWWNRAAYRHDLERDRQRLHAVEQDGIEAGLTLRNEIHHELIEIANARREAVAARQELLPRTDQALQAALAGWSSNRGMIADVLDARRMHLEARLSEARAIAEQWTRLHGLARLCGLTARETLRLATTESDPIPSKTGAVHTH